MISNTVNRSTRCVQSQYTAAAVVLLISLSRGLFNGWSTACLPLLISNESPVQVNSDQLSWIMSVPFFGHMISPIPAGLLMEKYGSKLPTLAFTLIIPIPSLVLIYITDNWKILMISRFLSGFWSGSVNTIAPMYLSEISKPDIRGFIGTMKNVIFGLGNIFALISALLISYQNLPIFYSIFILIFLSTFPLIPESPHYYIRRNDKISAKKSLIWLRKYENSSDIDKELTNLEVSIKKQMENGGKFTDLISTKGNRRAILIVETLVILQKLASLSSIISYLSITLPKTTLLEPSILVLIIEVLRMISAIISSMIIDRIGSKVLLLSCSSLCGCMMTITGFWYYFNSSKSLVDVSKYCWIPFLCITAHGILYSIGLNSVCNNIGSELFPINVKGKCSAITCMVSALSSFMANKMYLITGTKYGLFINFWIYATSNFLMTLFTSQNFIETKGKTLEQIQDELNKSNKK